MTSELLDNNNIVKSICVGMFEMEFTIVDEAESYVDCICNGLNIQMNKKLDRFNASKLMNSIKDYEKASWSAFMRKKHWNQFRSFVEEEYPDIFSVTSEWNVKGKGTQKYKGQYLPVKYLDDFLSNIDSMFAMKWRHNRLDDGLQEGYLYVMQSDDMKEDNVFKIGRTWNHEQRLDSYKCQKRHVNPSYVFACKVDDIVSGELKLKKTVQKNNAVQKEGEYYQFGRYEELENSISDLIDELDISTDDIVIDKLFEVKMTWD